MPEILISRQTWNKHQFRQMCGESLEKMQCSGTDGVMWPYEPYTIGQTTRAEDQIIQALRCGGSPRNLHALSTSIGQDNIVGVSGAMSILRDTTAATAGATSSVHAARGHKLTGAVQHYQNTLLTYRNVMKGGADAAAKASAGAAISTAFEHLQKNFQRELSMTAGVQRSSRRGTPLSNQTRAMNIARSSRSIEKLELVSTLQAGKLARFSKYGKVLGNGLILVDVGSRIGNVQTTYKADGNWEKELFIESSSFATSAIMGGLAVKAGVTFLVLATPVGWVGLIVTAAALSMGTNYLVKEKSGGWYDDIMEWINA